MKKRSLFLLLALSILLVSCASGEKKKVERVAKNYLTAFKDLDFEKAKQMGTPSAIEFLDEMDTYMKSLPTDQLIKRKKELSDVKVNIKLITLKGKRAEVRYLFEKKGLAHNVESLVLIQQSNGDWLVNEARAGE